jgi:tetratricopeptide (TPR) repeat protein
LSGIHWRRGELLKAVQFCEDSLKIYQDIEDVLGQARAYNNLSNAFADLGEWEKAIDSAQKSLEINQQIGNIQSEGVAANNLAYIHLDRGAWDRALALFQVSIAIWKKLGASLQEAVLSSNIAQVHIYQENLPAAQSELTHSQSIFDQIGTDDYLPELDRRWAEYYLTAGDPELALDHVQRSIELATQQDARLELGLSLRTLGKTQMECGEIAAARKSLLRSLEILRELKSEYEAAKTVLSLIQLSIKSEFDFNLEDFRNAKRTFKSIGAKADLEQASKLAESLNI